MKHYLVTGGAGFIGSHLCDALYAMGHEVTVVDNLSTGKLSNIKAEINFVEGDAADGDLIQPLIEQADGVFHLAAIASVQKSKEEWLNTTCTNLMATVVLLEAISKRSAMIPFVFASSAAIYGDPPAQALPLKETTPANPLTPYGADKYASELHARCARLIHSIPTLSMRFFNVYGPRQDPASPYSGVISIFANRIRRGEKVTIFGNGEQTRDFIYVADVVKHLMGAMKHLESDHMPSAPAINVCTGRAVSVNRLAEILASLSGVELNKKHEAARPGDIRFSTGDPALARDGFGMKAGTPLEEGLRHTLDWMVRP
jgi:UDP-glucose 4-epimerase